MRIFSQCIPKQTPGVRREDAFAALQNFSVVIPHAPQHAAMRSARDDSRYVMKNKPAPVLGG